MKKNIGSINGDAVFQLEVAEDALLVQVEWRNKVHTLGNLLRFLPMANIEINESLIEVAN